MIGEVREVLIHTFLIEVSISRAVPALVPDSNNVLCVAATATDPLVESLPRFRYTDFAKRIESKNED